MSVFIFVSRVICKRALIKWLFSQSLLFLQQNEEIRSQHPEYKQTSGKRCEKDEIRGDLCLLNGRRSAFKAASYTKTANKKRLDLLRNKPSQSIKYKTE